MWFGQMTKLPLLTFPKASARFLPLSRFLINILWSTEQDFVLHCLFFEDQFKMEVVVWLWMLIRLAVVFWEVSYGGCVCVWLLSAWRGRIWGGLGCGGRGRGWRGGSGCPRWWLWLDVGRGRVVICTSVAVLHCVLRSGWHRPVPWFIKGWHRLRHL